METSTNIVRFNFQGIELRESIWIDGKPYFTRRAIGEFLEYKRPQDQVDYIVRRNPYIKAFSTTVDLRVVDKYPRVDSHVNPTCESTERKGHSPLNMRGESTERTRLIETEVYGVVGFNLICMESNQPKAQERKIAASFLMEAYAEGKLVPSKWSKKGDFAAFEQILSAPPNFKRKGLLADLAERDDISLSSAYRLVSKAGRLLTRSGKPRKTRSEKDSYKSTAEYRAVLEHRLKNPGSGGKEIKSALGIAVSSATINRWLRRN